MMYKQKMHSQDELMNEKGKITKKLIMIKKQYRHPPKKTPKEVIK